MKVKKFLTAVLAMALAATSAAIPVFADEADETAPEAVETVEAPEEIADDAIELTDDPVWNGKGDEASPYEIADEEDFIALASNDTADKFFKLTNDITLTAPWITKIDFNGTLDGAKDENTNYEITGISIDDTASANRALFSTNSGTIKNITIRGSITARRAAGLVYENKNGGKIENCVNYCEVRATNKYEAYASGVNEGAGGIVEKNSGGSISKCFNYGNIFTNIDGGGIAALNNGTITESENYGSISPIEPDCKYLTLGGIAGRNGGGQFPGGTITNCKNYGDIEAISTNWHPGITIGGIAGNFVGTSTIDRCLNAGSLTTTDSSSDTGGIVGHMVDNGQKITLTNNANAGKVTAAEDTYYGAIIGCAPIPEDWTNGKITITNNTYLSNTSDLPYHYSPRSTFAVEAPTEEQLQAEMENLKPVSFDDMDEAVGFEPAEKVEVKLVGGAGGVYDIVLSGVGGTKINRFMSAELNFNFAQTEGSVGFEVVPNEDLHINMIRPENPAEDGVSGVYEFNLDGSKNEAEEGEEASYNADITNLSITLGKIVLTGHGKGTITVEETGSIVNTAEAEDNIVDHYTAEDTADPTLILPTEVPVEVSLEMGDLWVYVLFPNNIDITSPFDYNKMNVKIDSEVFGGESISVDLGYYEERYNKYYGKMDIPETLSDAGLAKLGLNPSSTKNQSIPGSTEGYPCYYFSVKVPANFSYTLTFSGEGYRTYTMDTIVYPGSNATNTEMRVFVWNNAMDKPDTPVVVYHNGEHIFKTAANGTTFLAGDIDDNKNIDLYDLSAAVAYFGKDNLYTEDVDKHEFVRYDLNRDGQIDSKDIAMVLVSWGK